MIQPLIAMPQGAEWLVILLIVIIVFGAAKLPDLARSTGQALKIFKNETKGLIDSDDDKTSKVDATSTSTDEARPTAPPARELPPVTQDGTSASTETTTEATTERHPR